MNQIPMARSLETEAILDTKVSRRTRRKEYLEYVVKWKGNPKEDSTWMSVADLEIKGYSLGDIMSRSS